MTMRDELDRATPAIDSLNAAIRENPLAAGLIGAGLAWMLMGGSKGISGLSKGMGFMAGAASGAVGKAGSAAAAAGSALGGSVARASSSVAANVKSATTDVIDSMASIVPDVPVPETDKAAEAVTDASSALGDRINAAAATGREYGSVIQSRLSDTLERQPLVLGAIGLAIGAGIASAFATTAVEREWMGEQATAARDALQGLAGEVEDRARQVMSDVKQEAARQGLTADAAKNAASAVGEKIKTVASAPRDSAKQQPARDAVKQTVGRSGQS